MSKALSGWARTERQFIRDELKWFNGGARLFSPSGEDITSLKVEELNVRLEHVNLALDDD